MYLEQLNTIATFETTEKFTEENAKEIAKYIFTGERLQNTFVRCIMNNWQPDNSYVIIKVQGYYCLAELKDDFAPYEIWDTVYPFDDEKLYPIQEIELKLQFKQY